MLIANYSDRVKELALFSYILVILVYILHWYFILYEVDTVLVFAAHLFY